MKYLLILPFETIAKMDYKSFLNKISTASGIDVETCEIFQEELSTLFERSLAAGDSISVPSFGNFEPRKRNERVMSHPSIKGKRILIPPKIVVNFKSSTILKNKVNNHTGNG